MSSHWLTPAEPVDPAWFEPLERFAAAAAALNLPVVNPDHFLYAARIERPQHPVLHAYRHVATRRYLNVDEEGTAWRYTGSEKSGVQRYAPFGRVDLALSSVDIERGNQLCGHLRQEAMARQDARRAARAEAAGREGAQDLGGAAATPDAAPEEEPVPESGSDGDFDAGPPTEDWVEQSPHDREAEDPVVVA